MNVMTATTRVPAEKNLIPTIKASKDKIAPKTNFIECEVNSGFGIADIVFFNLDTKIAQKRKQFYASPIKSFEILEAFSIINKLNSNRINITHLYKKLPYSEKTFKEKILGFLIQNEIARNIDNTYLEFQFNYPVPLGETIAVEAKISNWKRGLYQAYRYKQYADYSYLALHNHYLNRAIRHLDLFRTLNIGLLGVDEIKDEVFIVHKPQIENAFRSDKVRYFATEDILSKKGFIDFKY